MTDFQAEVAGLVDLVKNNKPGAFPAVSPLRPNPAPQPKQNEPAGDTATNQAPPPGGKPTQPEETSPSSPPADEQDKREEPRTRANRRPAGRGKKTTTAAKPTASSTTGNRPWSIKLDRDVSALLAPASRAWSTTLTELILTAAEQYHDQAAELPDAPDYTPTTGSRLFPRTVRQPKRRQTHHAYLSAVEKDTLDQLAHTAGLDRSTFCSRTLRALLGKRVFLPAHQLTQLATAAPNPGETLLARVRQLTESHLATIPEDRHQPWAEFPPDWIGEELAQELDQAQARLRAYTWTEVVLTALNSTR
ncbi:hypothetical protein TH66_00180 [Carbonactinospora thermoautotrophica]|uniref:Uncharacterized protein n=1 Tax=Carbonactinospora thermoautotrophica TaxID=1469144 RepID=A0A132N3V2_9ACTN|nr:hypothetical protein [Carbonactinospora thermoautotrophica]KWX04630.1 hypothetical protein TR74_24215 [Carbonactinospora thermoautotrophica]KWX05970.1 hypothetical protein TH66_00180 [Carbonactinospora thermoautotrophica]